MATKNCPKCDSPNPVACKKCACGHVFFTNRRSANALAAPEPVEDLQEPPIPQEVDAPRRRTARETRQRPQFYDALQVENQTRRQRELQKRRKASKSEEVEAPIEEPIEKPTPTNKRSRVESPPTKVVEPPVKKRRGRPPGLTNRKTGRAQILPTNKGNDAGKKAEGDHIPGAEIENIGNVHDVSAMKALQMNLVLSDINSRITSSAVRAENDLPPETNEENGESDSKMEVDEEEPDVKSSKAGVDNVDLKKVDKVDLKNVDKVDFKKVDKVDLKNADKVDLKKVDKVDFKKVDNVDLKKASVVEDDDALDTEQKIKEEKEQSPKLKEKVISDDTKVPDLKDGGNDTITKEVHPKIETEDSSKLNQEKEDKLDSKDKVSDIDSDNDNSSVEDTKDSVKTTITEIESGKVEKEMVAAASVAIDSDQEVDDGDFMKGDTKDSSKDNITNGDEVHAGEADVKKQLGSETISKDEVKQNLCEKAEDKDANINGRCALPSE